MTKPPPLPADRAAPTRKGRAPARRRRAVLPLLILVILLFLAGLIVVADHLQRQRRYEEVLAMVDAGRGEQAIPYLELRVRGNPDDPRARFALARALLDAERVDAAILHLEQVIEQRPDHGEAHLLLGRARLRVDATEAAERHLERARELMPERETVWLALGRLRYRQGRLLEAETALRRVQAGRETRGAAAALLGRVLYEQDRVDEALMILDGALLADPGSADVHFQLGEVHRLRGNPHVAVPRYDEARRLGLRTVACDLGLARALRAGGDRDRARRELEAMTHTHERAAEPWFELGLLQEDAGDEAGALACYERCLALDGEHEGARSRTEALRRTLGK